VFDYRFLSNFKKSLRNQFLDNVGDKSSDRAPGSFAATIGVSDDRFLGRLVEALRFGCEVQGVISARLMLFASGGAGCGGRNPAGMGPPKSSPRSQMRKVPLKHALADGLGFYAAAQRAYLPLRRAVARE